MKNRRRLRWLLIKACGLLRIREATFTFADGSACGWLSADSSRYTRSTQIGPTTWRLEVGEGGGAKIREAAHQMGATQEGSS